MLSVIVEANTGKAEAALKEFQRNLSKADREKAEAELAFQVEKGGYNVFSGLVKKADSMSADASLEFDVDQASLVKAKAAQAVLTKESSKLSDVFDRSQLSIGQWTGILAASIPVVFDLAGALGALTASLGAATAGLGALAVGGGAAGIVGIAGIASVAAPAIASLGDLKDAQDAYTEAIERYGKGSSQAETAAGKLAFEQKRAGPLATALSKNLSTLTSRWKELTKAGQSDFIGMLNDGVTRLNRKLPILAESANESMKALRVGFDRFLDRATGPEFNHFIEVMTNTFAKSVKPLAGAFGNIAKVLQRIAVAVAPDIVRMARGFEDMTESWVDSTRNAGKLRDTIHGLVNQANAWWKLIKATGELIVAVLVPGMGQGKRAVEGITETIKGWTDWVRSHPEEMQNFFKQGLETTKQLAQALLSFLPTLVEISKAMRPIARAFLVLVKGLNSLKIGSVSALTLLLGAIVGTKLVKGVAGITAAFGRLKVAALGAAAAEKVAMLAPGKKASTVAIPLAAEGGIGAQAAQGPAVLATPKGMNVASLAKYAKVMGGVAVAVTAAAGAFMALRDNFLGVRDVFTGFFEKVLKPLGDAFTDLIDELSGGHADDIFRGIGTALATIAKPLKFVVTNMTKLVGLLAIGGISAGFIAAITAIAAPIWVAIKAITLLIKGIKHLGRVVADVAKFIMGAWIKPGVLIEPFRKGVGKALDIFSPMKGKVADISKKIASSLRDILGSAWDAVKDIFQKGAQTIGSIFGRVGKRIGRIAGGIRGVFSGLAKVIHKVADFIVHAVDRMVGALGSIKDKIGDIVPSLPSLPSIPDVPGFKRGGPIPVPGEGVGDKVPLHVGGRLAAMVEPKEVIHVTNKKAAAAQEEWNRKVPRFQGGGGLQPAISGLMKKVIGQFGGSVSSGLRPGDDGFHGRGMAADWVGGDWAGAAKYANQIGSKLLEGIYTGAHGGPPVSWDSGSRVSPSFWGASTWAAHSTHIHFAVGQMVKGAIGAALEKIKKIKIKGTGAVGDIAQGSADMMREAANKYLAKIAPKVGVEKGVTKGMMSKGQIASVWRRANQGQGSPGLMAAIALAESAGNPRAVGYDPGGTQGLGLWQITTGFNDDLIRKYGGRSGMFNAFNNAQAAGDLLARQGLGAWVVYNSGAYRQHLKQGGVVDRTGVKHQAIAAPYVGAFKEGGPVAKTGLGFLHEGEHVIPKMKKGGLVAFDKGRGSVRQFDRSERQTRGLGIERIKQIRERLGKQLGRALPVLDERIDIAERLAGLTSSPAGSELSKGELREQMSLQQKLLDNLRKTLQIAKRGADLAKRTIERLEKHVKKLERKIKVEQRQMEQKVKRLTKFIKDEDGKDKPDREKIAAARERINEVKEKHGKPIAKWTEEARKKAQGATKLKPMLPAFRDAIVEMSGLTGRSGRIFDTKLSIKELRDAGKPQPLHIAELLEFAEAMRFGAFRRAAGPDSPAAPLPTFHQGGIVPGLRGQEVQVLARGGEVFQAPGQGAPVVNLEVVLSGSLEALNPHIDVRIREKDRDSRRVHRAGRRP